MKRYYLIRTTGTSCFMKICESYDEAVKEVPNFADWESRGGGTKGTCEIHEVDNDFITYRVYYFVSGKLTETKVWRED